MEREWQWTIATFCPADKFLRFMGVSQYMAEFPPFARARATLIGAMQMRKYPEFCKNTESNLSIVPQELYGERLGRHIMAFSALNNSVLLIRAIARIIGDKYDLIEYCASENLEIVNLYIMTSPHFYIIGYMHYPHVIKETMSTRTKTLDINAIESFMWGAIDSGLRRELVPLFELLAHTYKIECIAQYANLREFINGDILLISPAIAIELQRVGILEEDKIHVDVGIVQYYAYDTPEFQRQIQKITRILETRLFDADTSSQMSDIFAHAILNEDKKAFDCIDRMLPYPFKTLFMGGDLFSDDKNYKSSFELINTRINIHRTVLFVSFIDTISMLDNIVFLSCDEFVKFMNFACHDYKFSVYNAQKIFDYANKYYGKVGARCAIDALKRNGVRGKCELVFRV